MTVAVNIYKLLPLQPDLIALLTAGSIAVQAKRKQVPLSSRLPHNALTMQAACWARFAQTSTLFLGDACPISDAW